MSIVSAIGLVMMLAVSFLVIVVVFSQFLDKLPAQGGVADTVIGSTESSFYSSVALGVVGLIVLSSAAVLIMLKSLGGREERY